MSRVRLDIDLGHERFEAPPTSPLGQLERLFRERSVVEQADLLRLSAGAIQAFAERGFDRVDHWEFVPGGWLPLPEPAHRKIAEPVGHLVSALGSRAWGPYARAREFGVRLSGSPRMRADLRVRRVHRERAHSISVELYGQVSAAELRSLVRALGRRVPVLRARVAAYEIVPNSPQAVPAHHGPRAA